MTVGSDILIVAGPNGAGKTTFAREYLLREGGCPNFVNADYLALGLSPFAPELAAIRAGKLMLREIDRFVGEKISFAFETTLSGKIYARKIPGWRELGYRVVLMFLCLTSPEQALDRVRERVLQGGHNIPDDDVRRRFKAGLRNLELLYKPIVDHWSIYDNSGDKPVFLERGGRNGL